MYTKLLVLSFLLLFGQGVAILSTETNVKEKREAIFSFAKQQGNKAIPSLLSEIHQNQNSPDVQDMIEAIGLIQSTESTQALIGLLKGESQTFLKLNIINQLGKIKTPEVVHAFQEILKDAAGEQEALKIPIIEALSKNGEREAQLALLESLNQEKDPKLTLILLTKLSETKNPDFATQIIPYLQSQDPSIRLMAIYTLGNLGNPDAAKALVAVYSRTEEGKASYKLLNEMKEAFFLVNALRATYPHEGSSVFQQAALPVSKIDDGTIPLQMANTIRQMREAAFLGMIEAQDPEITAFVLNNDLTNDKEPYARALSYKVLGAYGDKMAVSKVIQGLQDQSPQVRWEAARALGKLKSKQGIDPLKNALNDPNPQVAIEAKSSLKELEAS
jgi:HEAT repeat protein